MTKQLMIALAAGSAALLTTGANAQQIYYQAGFSSDLYLYDVDTGVETLVGSMAPITDSTGMAFAPDGTLYALDRGLDALYTIDTATGAATLVGSTGTTDAESFTVALDGSVGFTTNFASLYAVDLATGATTLLLADLGNEMDGLTTAPIDVTVLGTTYAAGTLFGVDSGNIFAIDVAAGLATLLGSTGGADETLDFGSDGTLYGHGDDGFLYTIDLATLDATQLTATTPTLVFGMAVRPGDVVNPVVPEPASWAMMIAGFGLVGGALRRRGTAVRFA